MTEFETRVLELLTDIEDAVIDVRDQGRQTTDHYTILTNVANSEANDVIGEQQYIFKVLGDAIFND